MITVYIASPYTKGDPIKNVNRQMIMANALMELGYCPIVPLLGHFQNELYPRKYEDWLKIDLEKVNRCDVVFRLSGESNGADREVAHAKELGIPVVYDLTELTNSEIVERNRCICS